MKGRKQLGTLALGLCAVAVSVGSGADFSAQSANPENTFTSGTLKIDNSREGAAILQVANLQPGGPPQSGVVDIRNSGSLPGDFSLRRSSQWSDDDGAEGSAPFTTRLLLTVRDCGQPIGRLTVAECGDGNDVVVFNGSIEDMHDPVPVGRFQSDERHRFQFSVALSPLANNVYQGDSARVGFTWNAVQAPGA